MRLYLSSYQLGSHPERFANLVRGERAGWLIMNALDGALDQQRRVDDVPGQIDQLAAVGLSARNVDLRDGFDAAGQPDFVWVRGGNVFSLRIAFARSGFDAWITERIRRDELVYAGFSAGVCVLAPSLHGLEQCDPINEAIAAYGEVRFDGLGVLEGPVVPHLDSPGHPETDLLAAVAASYRTVGQQYWALRDGQALLIDERGKRTV